MSIDGATDGAHHDQTETGTCVDLRAEIRLLVALSACPDLPVGGKPVGAMIYES